MDSIGNRFKQWRIKNKLSVKDITNKTNLRASTISDIENDKNIPSGKTLLPLIKHYNIPVSYILTGDETLLESAMLVELYSKLNDKNKQIATIELRRLYDLQQLD